MFVDRVDLICQAGDGGDGCVSFRREAFIPRGGPDGGDGGQGGDIIVQADANQGSLAALAGHKHWKADSGRPGRGALCTGRSGEDAVILVPPGTLVKDLQTDLLLRDLSADGDRVVVAKGGRGGRGNKRFATPTDRAPRQFDSGEPGEQRRILLELKLIADVGIIGKPNAGKSTLLSRLSRATPEIADYPFTTKYPHLGVVNVGYDQQFVMADIPGLIEGAHAGVGLGHEFLKHVQRTRLFVHLVEPAPADQTDPISNYLQVREEMRLFDPALVDRPEIVAVSKAELPDASACAQLLEQQLQRPVLCLSAATGKNLPVLVQQISQRLQEANADSLST